MTTKSKSCFDLKQRVTSSLRKVADRDTHQMGCDELDRLTSSLSPDEISPFLSSISLSADSDPPPVRRHCVRLMGLLSRSHSPLPSHLLSKIVSSLLSSLKLPDSLLLSACIQTSSDLSDTNHTTIRFIVKPLFHALVSEQNRHVQAGSALCLAKLVDRSVIEEEEMLPRVLKLLKSPHFHLTAKPPLIQLITTILLVTSSCSTSALNAIIQCLSSAEWTIRKAAAVSLSALAPFASRSTCVAALQSCRFDKVKPVRDAVVHALQSFGSGSPQPSEAASSTKENRRVPLTARRSLHDNVQSRQPWQVEISIPKKHVNTTSRLRGQPEDLVKDDYDSADENPDGSPISDVVDGSFETKHVAHDGLGEGDLGNLVGNDRASFGQEVESEYRGMQGRKSLESTVTELTSHGMHGCCLQASNELKLIKKKLAEIDAKQSNLLELIQGFMCNSADSISTLQSKFHNLEHAIDKIAQGVCQSENYPSRGSLNRVKKIQTNASSPRISTSTPRPSVESNYRQSSLLSSSNKEYAPGHDAIELRGGDLTRNLIPKVSQKSMGRNVHSGSNQRKETRTSHSISAYKASAKQCNLERRSAYWKKIKELLVTGDVELAYVEVLCSGDDLILLELMDRTGPVIERLSHETADLVISTLTSHFQNQRFTDTIFPWFQQVVDISSSRKPGQLMLSSKTRMDLLFTLREVSCIEYIHPADRMSIAECASKLRQVWV